MLVLLGTLCHTASRVELQLDLHDSKPGYRNFQLSFCDMRLVTFNKLYCSNTVDTVTL